MRWARAERSRVDPQARSGVAESYPGSIPSGSSMHLPGPALRIPARCALSLAPSLCHAPSTTRERVRGRERERERDARAIRSVRISVERRERMPDHEISVSVGALRSQDDDVSLPMASLRTDWCLRCWLRSELDVSYAIGSIDRRRNGAKSVRVEQRGGISVAF